MKNIVIRADDFGYSEGINYGVAKCVENGLIKTIGLMTNMPSAKHGIGLLEGKNICYGLHANISVGMPLTSPENIPSLVQNNGQFKTSKEYRSQKYDIVNLNEAIKEIEAQLQMFIALTGERPHYIDIHAICSRNFLEGAKLVAKKHNIDFLDFSINEDEPILFRNTLIYETCDSMKENYDPFLTLKKIIFRDFENGIGSLICHPGYIDAYLLNTSSLITARAYEVDMLCSKEVKDFLNNNEIKVISFDDL